ncbi:Titin-like protein [Diplonema papillatum]|nr:Titin-like protein [Diplonema papillatum]
MMAAPFSFRPPASFTTATVKASPQPPPATVRGPPLVDGGKVCPGAPTKPMQPRLPREPCSHGAEPGCKRDADRASHHSDQTSHTAAAGAGCKPAAGSGGQQPAAGVPPDCQRGANRASHQPAHPAAGGAGCKPAAGSGGQQPAAGARRHSAPGFTFDAPVPVNQTMFLFAPSKAASTTPNNPAPAVQPEDLPLPSKAASAPPDQAPASVNPTVSFAPSKAAPLDLVSASANPTMFSFAPSKAASTTPNNPAPAAQPEDLPLPSKAASAPPASVSPIMFSFAPSKAAPLDLVSASANPTMFSFAPSKAASTTPNNPAPAAQPEDLPLPSKAASAPPASVSPIMFSFAPSKAAPSDQVPASVNPIMFSFAPSKAAPSDQVPASVNPIMFSFAPSKAAGAPSDQVPASGFSFAPSKAASAMPNNPAPAAQPEDLPLPSDAFRRLPSSTSSSSTYSSSNSYSDEAPLPAGSGGGQFSWRSGVDAPPADEAAAAVEKCRAALQELEDAMQRQRADFAAAVEARSSTSEIAEKVRQLEEENADHKAALHDLEDAMQRKLADFAAAADARNGEPELAEKVRQLEAQSADREAARAAAAKEAEGLRAEVDRLKLAADAGRSAAAQNDSLAAETRRLQRELDAATVAKQQLAYERDTLRAAEALWKRESGTLKSEKQSLAQELASTAAAKQQLVHERDEVVAMRNALKAANERHKRDLAAQTLSVAQLTADQDRFRRERDLAVADCKKAKKLAADVQERLQSLRVVNDALELEMQNLQTKEQDQCCICLEALDAFDVTGFGGDHACTHTVHVDCGRRLTGRNRKCPLCRAAFEFLTCDNEEEEEEEEEEAPEREDARHIGGDVGRSRSAAAGEGCRAPIVRGSLGDGHRGEGLEGSRRRTARRREGREGRRAARRSERRQGSPSGGAGTPPCWEFAKTGECRFGERCRFRHARNDAAAPACWDFATRGCSREMCRFRHVAPCIIEGCRDGSCALAHPPREQRQKGAPSQPLGNAVGGKGSGMAASVFFFGEGQHAGTPIVRSGRVQRKGGLHPAFPFAGEAQALAMEVLLGEEGTARSVVRHAFLQELWAMWTACDEQLPLPPTEQGVADFRVCPTCGEVVQSQGALERHARDHKAAWRAQQVSGARRAATHLYNLYKKGLQEE